MALTRIPLASGEGSATLAAQASVIAQKAESLPEGHRLELVLDLKQVLIFDEDWTGAIAAAAARAVNSELGGWILDLTGERMYPWPEHSQIAFADEVNSRLIIRWQKGMVFLPQIVQIILSPNFWALLLRFVVASSAVLASIAALAGLTVLILGWVANAVRESVDILGSSTPLVIVAAVFLAPYAARSIREVREAVSS